MQSEQHDQKQWAITENERRQKRPGSCKADDETTNDERRVTGAEDW